jgi:beta-1,2-mannosidase
MEWQLGPFTRSDYPVLDRRPAATFRCPMLGESVAWAAKDVFNPGAVVRDGRVHLLVRAEDASAPTHGTSRIGLAISDDGVEFELEPEPVLFPADDPWQSLEWPGGCEDPRVVEFPDGGYLCLYTGFDGQKATLIAATSDDLRAWKKHGPAFAGTASSRRWTKSGAVVTEEADGRLLASRIDGRYWMYWGEGTCFAATSDDLVRWTPVEFDATADRSVTPAADGAPGHWDVHRVAGSRVGRPVLFPRPGRFDSLLVEPGPPAVRRADGIVLIYNGANHPTRGDDALPPFSYQPGQALLDAREPGSCIARATQPFLQPEVPDEQRGQVDSVCFAQALVLLDQQWHLYFGMADSKIGHATAPHWPN